MFSPLFAVFGLGPLELAAVASIALLLFGNRLPEAMRNLGRSYKEFRHGVSQVEVEMKEVV